ncbi:hypothetical protein FGIG_00605 [Fasciola gigantica]|uniref:C2H2-type domain-containing protein n=1 Tax=Fasciola gigantica TaxID=46835 RepID=A0A504YNU6_FASGI|nr:hypothetical protein FGIG_00605 [Fasciola gigantica]
MSSFLVGSSKIDWLLMDQHPGKNCAETVSVLGSHDPTGRYHSLNNSLASSAVSVSDNTEVDERPVFRTEEMVSKPDSYSKSPSPVGVLVGVTPSHMKSVCLAESRDENIAISDTCPKNCVTNAAEDPFFPTILDSEAASSSLSVCASGCTLPESSTADAPDDTNSVTKSTGDVDLRSPVRQFDDSSFARGTPFSIIARGDANDNMMSTDDGRESHSGLDTEFSRSVCESITPDKPSSPKVDGTKELSRPDVVYKKQSPKVPRSASPPQVHRCSMCGKHYRHAASLRNHMRKHASGALASKRYRCSYCVYSSQYNRNVLKHIEAVHQNSDPFFPNNVAIPMSSSYPDGNITSNTNQTYWNPDSIGEHLYKTSEGIAPSFGVPNPCFYKQQIVRDDYAKFESVPVAVQCTENTPLEACSQIPTESLVPDQKSSPLYYCSVVGCGKSFKSMKYLMAHVNECHREVRFKCPVDGCQFIGPRQDHLKRHVNQHHTERKNSLQELLTQDRNDYSQQIAPPYMAKPQSVINFPEFCSSSAVRGQLINTPCKRHLMDFPGDVPSTQQQPIHSLHPQNSPEPVRRLGMDIYSFPGSVKQTNDNPSRFQQSGKFDLPLNELSGDRRYESRDDSGLQKLDDSSLGLMSDIRSGSSAHSASVGSASHAMHSDSPLSYKKPEISNFDLVHPYDNGVTRGPKSIEDWTPVTSGSVDGKSISIRSDSMVRSTVEQLLCAPDSANSSVVPFYHGSSDADLVAPEEFRSISGCSPVNDFTSSIQKSSSSNANVDEISAVEFDSPPNQRNRADSLSESAYQKHVNSETDAFFTDLQEILARDMPSLDNSTPKTVEWPNGDPPFSGLKEERSRLGDMGRSKSPFTGTGTKPICTASLMSGDSGLESWSSSSSCSAGPNSSSVWGPLESICNPKSSPDAHTPQPASVTGPSQLDSGALLNYEGFSDGQTFEESSVTSAVTANDHNRNLLDSNRAPSRTYNCTSEANNGCPPVSFAANVVHSGMGERSLVSPVISQNHSTARGPMGDKISNLTQRLSTRPITMNSMPNNMDVSCDSNRSNEPAFARNEYPFLYRQTERFSDPRSQQHSIDSSSSAARPALHFGQHQDLQHFHQRPHPPPQHHNDWLSGSTLSDAAPMTGVTSVNYDLHVSDTPRGRLPTCPSVDRLQPTQVQLQAQQQYCAKTNPCTSFEQNVYRSASYSRPMSTMMPSAHPGLDPSCVPQASMPNYSNPTQEAVDHRRSFAPCDANNVMESGGPRSVHPSNQVVTAGDVEMKSVTHETPFPISRANAYAYSDLPSAARADQISHSTAPNVRYSWSSGYPVSACQAYHQTQQQQQQQHSQPSLHQTQQPYKVYYNGPSYDQMQTGTNGMMYPVDQYGSHQAYSRQMGMTACDSQMFASQPQQQPHMQAQLVHNPTVTSSHVQFVPSASNTQSVDSFAPVDYLHASQRVQQLPHPTMRPPTGVPVQTGGPTLSRNPIPQSQLPVASYTVMDRRVPDTAGTTEAYPGTAGADLNPVWPSVDTCSTLAYTSELASATPPSSQVIRNGFKSHLASGSSNTTGMHPADPGHFLPSGVGGSYASDYCQMNRRLPETDLNLTSGPCTGGANGPPPNATSLVDRGLGPHVTSVSATGHTSTHHKPPHPIHVPNQASDVFDNTVPVCPIVANR